MAKNIVGKIENIVELRKLIGITMLITILVTSSTGCSPRHDSEADLVLTGGHVYTLNWPQPDKSGKTDENAPYSDAGWHADAEAVAISDGIIVAVGTNKEIQSLISKIDLRFLSTGIKMMF